ncbi:hypothetical protein BG261_04470 [Floricoccus tropicus]|uniref:Beta-1,6-galactofuranosyltransferase n=1 Tax=Floricoccus tropicus TaxID=1859473 RepID=A0A1E8GNC3_9LACT|nr:hypothetical protein [Floricoccus tropicus]OFI49133.1 hypothetical protein BG261_04470 [Floricoccus tropicus]
MTIWTSTLVIPDYYSQNELYVKNKQTSQISNSLGFESLEYYTYNDRDKSDDELAHDISVVVSEVKTGDIVFLQYPMLQANMRYDIEFIRQLKEKNTKLVGIVWDIPAWEFDLTINAAQDDVQKELQHFDILIVENKLMKDRIKKLSRFKKKLFTLGLTDYLLDNKTSYIEKSNNIYQVGGASDELISLNNIDKIESIQQFLLIKKYSGFGFVVNNDLNNSIQLSIFLSIGLPVVIPSTSHQSNIIKEYKLGIVYSSLKDLQEQIDGIDNLGYENLKLNLSKVSQLASSGFFTKRAMIAAVDNIYRI